MKRSAAYKNEKNESGFTILEVLVFTVILTMGLLALTSTSLTVHSLRRASDERASARTALESVIEEMQRTSVVLIDADPSWSEAFLAVYGPGGTIGTEFDVDGLDPQDAAPSVGTVQIITDETLTDLELDVRLDLPVDLDNDGAIDNADVSQVAEMLPVIVRVAWSGVNGDQELRQEFFVLSF